MTSDGRQQQRRKNQVEFVDSSSAHKRRRTPRPLPQPRKHVTQFGRDIDLARRRREIEQCSIDIEQQRVFLDLLLKLGQKLLRVHRCRSSTLTRLLNQYFITDRRERSCHLLQRFAFRRDTKPPLQARRQSSCRRRR